MGVRLQMAMQAHSRLPVAAPLVLQPASEPPCMFDRGEVQPRQQPEHTELYPCRPMEHIHDDANEVQVYGQHGDHQQCFLLTETGSEQYMMHMGTVRLERPPALAHAPHCGRHHVDQRRDFRQSTLGLCCRAMQYRRP